MSDDTPINPSRDIPRLIEIMAALRTPKTGCPWDLEQTFETVAPYTLEEAYEVADAIERGDLVDLKDELGDLLLQVVYHARLAEEEGAFSFGDIVEGVTKKMIRRHPHVFADATARAASDVNVLWERIKAEEARKRKRRGVPQPPLTHSPRKKREGNAVSARRYSRRPSGFDRALSCRTKPRRWASTGQTSRRSSTS